MSQPNEKLRRARKQRNWSQEQAAATIGVDRKTYIRWEQGQNSPQPGTLELACQAYELSAEALGFTDDKQALENESQEWASSLPQQRGIQSSLDMSILFGEKVAQL